MSANKGLIILQEIIWLFIAVAVGTFVVYPLYSKLNYIFLAENFVFAVSAVLLFRLVFFFKSITWLQAKWARFLLFAVSINYFIFILYSEQKFVWAYDSYFLSDLGTPKTEISLAETEQLFRYFYTEIHLTVITCLILIILLTIRLISSYWSLSKTRLYVDTREK